MEKSNKILKILIPAVGGQGGGVLTEWLINAFLQSGYEVQGISLPGLSQRAGSTVYYLETYKPQKQGDSCIFSQYPLPGDVDIIICQEFLELGRVLEQGYGSDKTTIISSRHRIYSTPEKLPVSSGIFPLDKLERIAREFSSRFIGIDALQIAKDNDMEDLAVNAILFGAAAASKSLPLSNDILKNAIDITGISVRSNLLAFDVGYKYIMNNSHETPGVRDITTDELIQEKTSLIIPGHRESFLEISTYIREAFPESLREILIEAVFRLTDYQNPSYACKYMEYFEDVFLIDKSVGISSYLLSEHFAKNLALLMSYEDGIRVAELKVKSPRFRRIREEMQIREGQLFSVTDYLKPDAYEIYGLLPNFIILPFLKIAGIRPFAWLKRKNKKLTLAQKPLTTSFSGFLRLWLLTKIKFLRPISHRHYIEFKIIEKYMQSTVKYSKINYDLGLITARSGSLVKGYGDVRRRTMNSFIQFIDSHIEPASKKIIRNPSGTEEVISGLGNKLREVASVEGKT